MATHVRSSVAGRLAALDALTEGPGRETAILAALEDETPAVRQHAIRMATRYIEPEVLGELVADEANATRRNAAIVALERQGPYAVPHLRTMLGRPELDVVMFALQMLARIGDPAAVPSILPLVRHPDLNIAQSAVEALGQLRNVEAVPALLELLYGELWLQLAAIDALGEIGDPRAVGPLVALVPDSVVAEPAVRALQRIAAPESLDPLLARLPQVRERPLRDLLLLTIAVVIDLHPDPVPVALQYSAELQLDPADAVLDYLREILGAERSGGDPQHADRQDPDALKDATSLLRAATGFAVTAGLRSLFPLVLTRIATDEGAAWGEGVFRRCSSAVTPALRELLQHTDPRVRRGALLVGAFEAEDLPRVLQQLEDADEQVRAAACRAMGLIGEAAVVPLLIKRLREGEPGEQATAVSALSHFSVESMQELVSCLGSEVYEPVLLGALEVLGKQSAGLFEARITELTRHPSHAVRRAAIQAAARLSVQQAEVLLLRALADRHKPIQVDALQLLIDLGGSTTVPTLVALLGRSDSLRYHVIRALGHMRATDAVQRLQSLYQECEPHEQAEILLALIRINGPGVAGFLRHRLSDPETELRRIAAHGIAGLADQAQLPLLLSLASDGDWNVRNESARGLGLLGLMECRDPLLTLVRDMEPVVAKTARAALDRLRTAAPTPA